MPARLVERLPNPLSPGLRWRPHYTTGVTVRIVWVLLALLLTLLTVGGLISVTKNTTPVGAIGDLVISCLLGWGALGSWKRARA